MGDATRTVEVWLSHTDTTVISQNGWNFQIAKCVRTKSSGPPVWNTVWQSKQIAPLSTITWRPVYGFNWTASMPRDGATVSLHGKWQECDLGEVFDLNEYGFFVHSEEKPTQCFMKIGKLHYKYENVLGIHIIIGIKNEAGQFETIFIDPVALPPNASAQYQPQDEVKWWYEAGMRDTTLISKDLTATGSVDLSKPNKYNEYYYSTTFSFETGSWNTSADRPPQSKVVPTESTAKLEA